MTATKALILTWVVIGLLVAGVIGFFLGRNTLPQPGQQAGQQPPGTQGGQPQGSPLPSGQRPSQGQQTPP